MHLRTGLQQLPGQRSRRADHVFAVIEDQQQLPAVQVARQRLVNSPLRIFWHAQRLGDRSRHQQRVRYGRQLYQPDALREIFQQPLRGAQRQARLAGAARAG